MFNNDCQGLYMLINLEEVNETPYHEYDNKHNLLNIYSQRN